jgi:hypothetical protein
MSHGRQQEPAHKHGYRLHEVSQQRACRYLPTPVLGELRASPQCRQGLGRAEGREPKAHSLALKGGKSPADSPGFHAIPAWYRKMQIGS